MVTRIRLARKDHLSIKNMKWTVTENSLALQMGFRLVHDDYECYAQQIELNHHQDYILSSEALESETVLKVNREKLSKI
jgi:hypothetical protein